MVEFKGDTKQKICKRLVGEQSRFYKSEEKVITVDTEKE